MSISWKKLFVKLSDLIIFVYLIIVFVSIDDNADGEALCKDVDIEIGEGGEGFLDKAKIEEIMKKEKIYPLSQKNKNVDMYQIEKVLSSNPFISSVNCYKTHKGIIKVVINQRIPAFMAVTTNNDRYFMDKSGKIMPENVTAPYVMIVTGTFNRNYAKQYLIPLVSYINNDEFWHSQIEQINILEGGGVELVPRVGDHIVYIGNLPVEKDVEKRNEKIRDFMSIKFSRLKKFYKYGLNNVGWNKYSYINIEFDNQIICKRNK